jgi:hypothetical protein
MQIAIEYTLNRGWIRDEIYGDEVGEKNFTVPGPWLIDTIERHWKDIKPDDFLDAYEPEVEGEFIYRLAQRADVIINEGYCFDENYDLCVNLTDNKIYFYDNAVDYSEDLVTEEDLWDVIEDRYKDDVSDLFELLPDWAEQEIRATALRNDFTSRFMSVENWRKHGGKDEYLRV